MKKMRINLIRKIEENRNELIQKSKNSDLNFDCLIENYDKLLFEQYKQLEREMDEDFNMKN